jgi:hypothetical protein
MPNLDTKPAVLDSVEVLTLTFEIAADSAQDVLPPGLHPTIPPLVTWMVWRCAESDWGPFAMAQTRVECRSGARPRAYLVGAVVDGALAGDELAARWGFACRTGDVSLERSYDRISAEVTLDGRVIFAADAVDPVPLGPTDVQWMANMNLAQTPRGLRLVQVDPDYDVTRAERARPILTTFDAAAWGEERITPVYPVAASFTVATVTLPRIRYLSAPDQLAFFATEVVG